MVSVGSGDGRGRSKGGNNEMGIGQEWSSCMVKRFPSLGICLFKPGKYRVD